MNIQQKLVFGLGFLFILIAALAAVSISNVHRLSDASRSILEANYQSLEYIRGMYHALDNDPTGQVDSVTFARNLSQQARNITEIGEKEFTEQLAIDFKRSYESKWSLQTVQKIRTDLHAIMTLNMQALERKSVIAESSGRSASTIIAATASLCIILALILIVNLPRTITKPIKELREGIQQISAKNYSARLRMDRKDEFRDIANAFNLLAVQLSNYYSSSISKIMSEKHRVESLVNSMHDPVLILDEQRMVLFANRQAASLLLSERSILVGSSATEAAVHNDLLRNILQAAFDTQSASQSRSLKVMHEGREQYFDVEHQRLEIAPSDGAEIQYMGDVIVLRNVTEFREHDVAKSSFMATVSHELKTPISSIKFSLQLLERIKGEDVENERSILIRSMEEDCSRLSKISSELLSISQSETGNISLAVQACRPDSLLSVAISAVSNLADQRSIRLMMSAEHLRDLPLVKADAEKVTWVLINFLTNAVRYSPEHSEVSVGAGRHEMQVEFYVQDRGKGIEERYRDRIFERYFQIPGSSKSGSGLGLAISREFIEALGGSIGVDSELGGGSRFWFRLAVAPIALSRALDS